jgi:hypothetical protein
VTRFVLHIFCLFLWNSTFSQIVNVERARIYEDSGGWAGSIDAGVYAIQNDKLLFNSFLRPRVQYKTRKHYYLLLTDWSYTIGGKEVFSNFGMAHFRYHYRLYDSPWKWESYVQGQYNQLLDERARAIAGTGIRVKMLDKNNWRLYAGMSGFIEYEQLKSTNRETNDFRSSTYISWFYDNKKAFSFTGVTYYQPNLGRFKDFRFLGQYTLLFRVFKRIDLKFEINAFYDSEPPVDVRQWVFNSHFGVRIQIQD